MRDLKKIIHKYNGQSSSSIKRAAVINLIAKYATVLIGVGNQLILARLLTPYDYGVMAVLTVFTGFFSMIADGGASGAIVQHQSLSRKDINSIYAVSFRISILLALIFILLAYPIALFYDDSVYVPIGFIMAFTVFFSSMNTVPSAILFKNKFFFMIGMRQFIVSLMMTGLAILLAMLDCGVYSLGVSSAIGALATYVWNVIGTGLNLQWRYNRKSVEKVKNFSLNSFGFNFINYFARNTDNLLIGKFYDVISLGNYNKAYSLMVYPMGMFTHIVTPVLLPFLAERQDDKNYIYGKFLQTTKLLSLIGVFITVFVFFYAKELVLLLLGDQWTECVGCFQFLSLSIWSQMICATSGTIFEAINRTDLMFKRGLITSGTTIICTCVGVMFFSLEYTALLISLSYISNFFSMLYFLVKKGLQINISLFCQHFAADAMLAICLIFVCILLRKIPSGNDVEMLLTNLPALLAVYVVLLIVAKQIKYIVVVCPASIRNDIERICGR